MFYFSPFPRRIILPFDPNGFCGVSVFLDAADVVLAKRRISDVATMLHLRYAVICLRYGYARIYACARTPQDLPLTSFLQPRDLQAHLDEYCVGHPLQRFYDPPSCWCFIPKVFSPYPASAPCC